jgi:hypothetical protein
LEIYNTFYSQNYEFGNDKMAGNCSTPQSEDIQNIQIDAVMQPSIILQQQPTQIPISYDQQNFYNKYQEVPSRSYIYHPQVNNITK